jgi:hypothetical protein
MEMTGIRSPLTRMATAVLLGAAGLALAATPAEKCAQGKNKEAGKYAFCRQKVEAKFAAQGDVAARTAGFQKCLDKYAIKWPLLESKAVAAGDTCPSTGDQSTIQGVIEAHTTNVATALAGGGLSNCAGDLATCQVDLGTCQGDLGSCLAAPQGLRIQTGQRQCWNAAGTLIACAGTAHDGEVQNGLAGSYTDNGDGTITDERTGLMWEKLSDDGSIHDKDTLHTWSNAFAVKIDGLNTMAFAGYADWRLPNVNELQSIVSYGAASPAVSPPFNTACVPPCTVLTCSCTRFDYHWSSTSYQNFPQHAWFVHFGDGGVSANSKSSTVPVRAVRGGS